MERFVLATLGILVTASSGVAQVERIAPFEGAWSDGLETQAAQGFTQCVPERIFSGRADLCSVGGAALLVTPAWVHNCVVNPHAGSQFVGVGPGSYPRIVFDEPVRRFGTYLATNGASGIVTVRFFDSAGWVMYETTAKLFRDCGWYWNGFESEGAPFAAIELENSVHGGGHLMLDDLEADPGGSPGTSFCTGSVNSAGQIGVMLAGGSTSIGRRDLVLQASGLPAGTRGLFFYGSAQAQVPFGTGLRCVSTPLARLRGGRANAQGTLVERLEYGGAGGQGILPGSTWYFQAWYRDPALGGPRFGTTDALALTFGP